MKKITLLLTILIIATVGIVVASISKKETTHSIEKIKINLENPGKNDMASWD